MVTIKLKKIMIEQAYIAVSREALEQCLENYFGISKPELVEFIWQNAENVPINYTINDNLRTILDT